MCVKEEKVRKMEAVMVQKIGRREMEKEREGREKRERERSERVMKKARPDPIN